jgi:serine/threonine-protein kinase
MIELRTLGSLVLRAPNGEDLQSVLAQPKRVALLAFLAIARPRGFHRRDTLLALLWPEQDGRHARWALNQALRHLRNALGKEVVPSRGDEEVGVDPRALRCDAVEFEAAIQADDPARALELYQGDLLDGLHVSGCDGFERWLEEERVWLRRRAAQAAAALARREEDRGEPVAATLWARRACALAPEDEGEVRNLIGLLDRTGDRAGAVRVYEEFARWLRVEYEVDPAPETIAAIEAVRARQPMTRPPPAPPVDQPAVEAEKMAPEPAVLALPPIQSWFAARLSRPAWATLVALGLVLVVVIIGRSIRASWSGPVARAVAPAAETIAILPFNTAGPRMEFLREGMMDLLTTNLDGVGGIRIVEPRVVLRTWGRRTMSPGDRLDQALDAGRKLGAASIVIGSAVSVGEDVRLAADLYSIAGERLGRALVDGPADSVLQLVDRLSVTLLRDHWRSRGPLPNLRLAALTTDSPEALRSYLQGEASYRRFDVDSALAAYTRAVEVDSTFALAYLRRALVYGWIGGHGNEPSREVAAAGFRFVQRLPPRDRRLLIAYRLFERGKPASVDSLRAFVADYPDDIEGWNLLGESMFHTREFRPVRPDSIVAAFDSVLRRDSTLLPATVHPVELTVSSRDSATLARYSRVIERRTQRSHSPRLRASLHTAADWVWGRGPADSAFVALMALQPVLGLYAIHSVYIREEATSDSVLAFFYAARAALPTNGRVAAGLGHALVGLGRLEEAKRFADTLMRVVPDGGVLELVGWPIALGIAPPAFGDQLLDSIIAAREPGFFKEYLSAMKEIAGGRTGEARGRIASALASHDTTRLPEDRRGLLIAADGWARLVEGDSVRGLQRLRAAMDTLASPGQKTDHAFFRFQIAVALAAEPGTRSEGIHWLRYGFDQDPLCLPLSYFELGRSYEAANQRDSAAYAYRRFLRLWDKADPSLRNRVHEAREALARLTAEPAS